MQLLPFTLVSSTLIPCLFVGIQYPSLSQTTLWRHVSIINSKNSNAKTLEEIYVKKKTKFSRHFYFGENICRSLKTVTCHLPTWLTDPV